MEGAGIVYVLDALGRSMQRLEELVAVQAQQIADMQAAAARDGEGS